MARRVLILVFALYLACLFSADEWISTLCRLDSKETLQTVCQRTPSVKEDRSSQAEVLNALQGQQLAHTKHLAHSKHFAPAVSDEVLAPDDQDYESVVFPPYILVPAPIVIPKAPPLLGIPVTPREARGPPLKSALFPSTAYRGPPYS